MDETSTIYAIIPAAGHSIRMGRPKLALPLGNTTVIEAVIAALRTAGIPRVLVITAPHSSDLVSLAESAGAEICALEEPTPDMRTTVEFGLRFIEERYHPRENDFWILIPADHPLVKPSIVRHLLKARYEHPEFSIYVPIYGGRRGHPVLISWKHVSAIRLLAPEHGINSYLRPRQAETLEIPVTDETILTDLDKPGDYEALLALWKAK